ncbi:hypothetical protein RDI58_013088 [Solanum bulbocastanum]|uniref:Uncharacterized protein n=1 Tax=Solanum bulbocastanum TaxID=147425 RepID=A0AAN8TM64_SOLBU
MKNNELCESSNHGAYGSFGSFCITGIDKFEKQQLTIRNSRSTQYISIKELSVVISDPSYKYVEVDQVYNDKAILNFEVYTLVCFYNDCNMKMNLGVDVTYMGTPAGWCSKLPKYLYKLDTNPGSHMRLKKTDGDNFLFLFVALDPFIEGSDHWQQARWMRITAVWFFKWLRESHGKMSNMCVVSDRNGSIIKAITREILKVNEAMSTRMRSYVRVDYSYIN